MKTDTGRCFPTVKGPFAGRQGRMSFEGDQKVMARLCHVSVAARVKTTVPAN